MQRVYSLGRRAPGELPTSRPPARAFRYFGCHHILNIAHMGINFLLTINVNGYDIVIYLAIPHGVLFKTGNVVVV